MVLVSYASTYNSVMVIHDRIYVTTQILSLSLDGRKLLTFVFVGQVFYTLSPVCLLMRILKTSGNHLRKQTWKNLVKAILCFALFGIVFLPAVAHTLLYMRIELLEELLLAVSLIPLTGFYYFLHRYRIYRSGWEGEKRVAKLLNATLSDDYFLINGLHFHGEGDIDHIILGPNGIFVVETKNWRGIISCSGDEWQRQNNRPMSGSPSIQVKKNATKLKRVIEDSLHFSTWIEPLLVFSNRHADLRIRNPTVPVLKLHQLPSYITSYKTSDHLSLEELEQIGREILKTD